MWASKSDERCVYHTGQEPMLPGAVQLRRGRKRKPPPRMVELPTWHPDFLPGLKRELHVLPKLKAWAAEFDTLDEGRYSALQFVEWLELELAPPAKPKEDCGPVYSLVGQGVLALGSGRDW